jgi:CTP:molybdopterin cytidylyltransferase MocA
VTRFAGLVLAAGGSTRMGRPKLLLRLADGRTLLAAAVEAAAGAGLDPVVVVLGADAERTRPAVPAAPAVRVIVNERWAEGLSSSMRAGLDVCGGADAVLVTLADLAGQTSDRFRAVAAAAAGAPLVVPVTSHGRATHPVLFGRSLWEELRALSGDRGAREVVRRHLGEAARVELPPLRDVDTEADYGDALAARPADPSAGWEIP